jgi:hypothetical protein
MAAVIPTVDVNRDDLPAVARNIEELEDIPFQGVIDPTLCYIVSGAGHAYALTQDTLNHYRSDDSKFYKCHIALDEQALGVRDEDYDRTPGNELYRLNLAATYYIKKSIADQLSIGVAYRIHNSDEPVGPIVSERYFIDVANAVENAAVGAEKCHIVYPDMIQNIERLNIVGPAGAGAPPINAFTIAEVTAEVDDLEALQNQLRNIYYEGGAARADPNAENGTVLYNSINFIVPGVLERLRAIVTPDTAAVAQVQLDRITAIVTFVTNDAAFAGLRMAPGAVGPIALPIAPIVAAPVAAPAEVAADAAAALLDAPPAEGDAEPPAEVPVDAGEAAALVGAPPAEVPPLNEALVDAGEAAAPAEGNAANEAPAEAGEAAADAGVAPPGAPAPQVVPPAIPAVAAGPFAQLFAARAAAVARPPAAPRALPPAPAAPAAAPVAARPFPPAPPALLGGPAGGPAGGPPAARPALHPGLDVAAIIARVGPRVGARVRPAGLPPI